MDCHQNVSQAHADGRPVNLVGNPNVGKSAIFAGFTGRRVDVSNYPGTTVELAYGRLKVDGSELPLIDTPGIQSLLPRSADEHVTRDVLTAEAPWAVVQVADSKNLRRALLLTFQLAEHDVPLVLALNMADEAEALGIRVDMEQLAQVLGADVVKTVATRHEGLDDLRAWLISPRPVSYHIRYDGAIEAAISQIVSLLPNEWTGKRALALASLAGDDSIIRGGQLDRETEAHIRSVVAEASTRYDRPLGYIITQQRLKRVDCLLAEVWQAPEERRLGTAERLGRLMVHPVWGWPFLALVLVGLYLFVGQFGAGVLVDWVEGVFFGDWVNPLATQAAQIIPIALVRDFLVGEYGIVTMALSYGIAIVLPIVFTFFLAFILPWALFVLPNLAS